MADKKQINIGLSKEMAIKLKMDAYENSKTCSEIVEAALNEYYAKPKA